MFASAYFRLACFLKIGLHLYPLHVADTPFFMYGFQATVGIFGLTQGGHCCGVQASCCGGINFCQQLSFGHLLPVFYHHFGERSPKDKGQSILFFRPDIAYIVAG